MFCIFSRSPHHSDQMLERAQVPRIVSFRGKCIFSKCIFAKCTRLMHLLSSASLFLIYTPSHTPPQKCTFEEEQNFRKKHTQFFNFFILYFPLVVLYGQICDIIFSEAIVTSSQAPRCASWKLTSLQAEKLKN